MAAVSPTDAEHAPAIIPSLNAGIELQDPINPGPNQTQVKQMKTGQTIKTGQTTKTGQPTKSGQTPKTGQLLTNNPLPTPVKWQILETLLDGYDAEDKK
ncbi:hypothetical protein DPMN_083690 [Dreissena polymorpha]|uniref:Uncharacterized protein n=1 Tax=Dreissena polymorpha TaxID=45954 RepID=A0A9D3YD18_DREPO|nr:hypothetical protein DPMN_083690 [Dreissena polymorpha]